MKTNKAGLDLIKQRQIEFQHLVQESSVDELGQCAKLLAMYVAVYKQQYGDIPIESLLHISETVSIDQELSEIIQSGIEEASSMLRMVHDEQKHMKDSFFYESASGTVN